MVAFVNFFFCPNDTKLETIISIVKENDAARCYLCLATVVTDELITAYLLYNKI